MSDSEPQAAANTSDLALWIKHIKSLGPVVVTMVIISAVLPATLGIAMLVRATSDAAEGLAIIDQWGIPIAALVAIAVFALSTGSALMPTYALSYACGVYFGQYWGSGVAVLGAAFGALVGYAWGALLARNRVMQVVEANPKAAAIHASIVKRSFRDELLAITLIRIPPNSPFAITNLVMSASGVRLIPYTIGSAVGIAPRTIAAALIGAAVGEMSKRSEAGGRLKWAIGIAVAVIIFLILYRLFSKWAREGLASLRDLQTPPDTPIQGPTQD
ncbi:MAG: TVP38/TMEM64 family protein [Phycisphaerales bacterium]|nr:TVP38/TMEM64 family protein [Phycisphaerales bacterium]